jgi:ATP-dependent Clp protease ATP-binding subunit ClpC
VIKYFDLIDEFIKVRNHADEILAELQRTPITDKASYRRRVVEVCIPLFEQDVLGAIAQLDEEYDPEIVEELVYQICIDVNPALEIHQVSLPATATPDAAADPRAASLFRKAMGLEKALRAQIVGQDEAVSTLVRAVKKSAVGLNPPGRPIGTFLLVGRTGTGKTELAKAIARSLFDDGNRLVRIDCSEYALPHEYAKLIGSPPGYIGHSEGGYLTETVKKLQSCVVLFDEIEKAHSKVHNLLLQVLDEGILTDSKGQLVSFAQSLVIMTSNLGIEKIDAIRTRMGFRRERAVSLHDLDLKEVTLDALKEEFRPEFINRIDDVVLFNPLDHKVCARIAHRMLRDLAALLARQGIAVECSPGVRNALAREGYSEEYGARELRRLIKRKIEDPLTELILGEQLGAGACLQVRMHRGEPRIEVVRAKGEVVSA